MSRRAAKWLTLSITIGWALLVVCALCLALGGVAVSAAPNRREASTGTAFLLFGGLVGTSGAVILYLVDLARRQKKPKEDQGATH